MKSRIGTSLQEGGNATAATRSMSHFSKFAWFNDQIGGIAFYRKLQEITGDFEGKKDKHCRKDKQIRDQLSLCFLFPVSSLFPGFGPAAGMTGS